MVCTCIDPADSTGLLCIKALLLSDEEPTVILHHRGILTDLKLAMALYIDVATT